MTEDKNEGQAIGEMKSSERENREPASSSGAARTADKVEGDVNAQVKQPVDEGQMGAPIERGQGGSGQDREGADDRMQSTDR